MELTIEQALQHGIAAHRVGKLEEAERLYRDILQSQPLHPDANHNLGVIAVSVNKADEALPLFKTALEANPKIEQFWLSYIEALIKETQFDNAKQVLEQAKKHELDNEKLHALKAQIPPISHTEYLDSANPSQQQLNSLLEYYQTGRLSDAEKLALYFTQEFPKYQLGWKVLGAVLGQTGRKPEAVYANQEAVALSSQDAEAHNNLGATFQELGRLEEAIASYSEAIALKPAYAEAYYNLGVTLKELGRLEESEAGYNQAIALKPDFAEAHSSLGTTLEELGRLEDAEASYMQAIVLNKNEPRYVDAYANLIPYLNEACSARFKLEKLWKESSIETGTGIMLPLAINRFLMGDLKGCRQIFLSHFSSLLESQKLEINSGKDYWGWLGFLLEWHDENPQNEHLQLPLKTLYVIGDSHSLAYHGITLDTGYDIFLCKSEWIWGCKQFHIGNQQDNKFKYKLDKLFSSLPPASSVLLSIGEIDCRLDDGIIPHCKKNPEKKIQHVVSTTIDDYLDYILEKSSAYLHKVTIQGIPCPNVDRGDFENQEIEELIELIQKFNGELKAKSISYGLGFLNLSTITNDSNGFSNGLWHADAYHITPYGALEALRHNKFK